MPKVQVWNKSVSPKLEISFNAGYDIKGPCGLLPLPRLTEPSVEANITAEVTKRSSK